MHHAGGGQGKIVLQVMNLGSCLQMRLVVLCVCHFNTVILYCTSTSCTAALFLSPRPPTVPPQHHVRGGLKFVWPDTVWRSTSAYTPSVVGFTLAQCGLGMKLLIYCTSVQKSSMASGLSGNNCTLHFNFCAYMCMPCQTTSIIRA